MTRKEKPASDQKGESAQKMTKQETLLVGAETEAMRLMSRQDPASGALCREDGFADTRSTGFGAACLLSVYSHPQSRLYGNADLGNSLEKAREYLCGRARPSGMFDLSSCNFDSAPDTAFTVNALLDALSILRVSGLPERDALRRSWLDVMERACEGICTAGFHTPNHRWAIASCLLGVAAETGSGEKAERFRTVASRYLAEGLDISEDGEFAERSSGTYNAVNDDQMVRLYRLTGDSVYLEAARKNLELMLCFMEPDGTVFTMNSTRQDHGQKVYPGEYFILYLAVGYLQKDPAFAAFSQVMWDEAVRHGRTPGGLALLRTVPELEAYGTQTCADTRRLEDYARLIPGSGIGRWRRGTFCVTALCGKPDFLYIRSGAASVRLSVYANVCDRRNFTCEAIEPLGDDRVRMACRFDSWYYLPFEEGERKTSDWWAMDNVRTRQRQVRASLLITVDAGIDLARGEVRLSVKAEGLSGVPLRLEAAFTGGEVRTESLVMQAVPGGEITLLSGTMQLTGSEGDILTLGPCFGTHHVLGRMGGALPRSESRFTVYLTDVTPSARELTIGSSPAYPPFYSGASL